MRPSQNMLCTCHASLLSKATEYHVWDVHLQLRIYAMCCERGSFFSLSLCDSSTTILKEHDPLIHVYLRYLMCSPMIAENRQLVTDEPVEFEEITG